MTMEGTQFRKPKSRSRSRASTAGKSSRPSRLRLQMQRTLDGYMHLDLSNQQLVMVPHDLARFTRLESLNLAHNSLRELPQAIGRLRSLKILQLQGNKLHSLPDTLTNCSRMSELNLTQNKLSTLPRNISGLKALKVLKLGQNSFENLPHDISLLTHLQYLDLHHNRIWYLPFSLQSLTKLKFISLANNKFEHLPLPICQISPLRVLNLRGNGLHSLPPDFEMLKNIQELNLSFNRFESIPSAVYKLKELRYLNLAYNVIKYVAQQASGLSKLEIFHIQGNLLSNIPSSLYSLKYLNVANNQLFSLSLAGLSKLKAINANNNQLENLPMGIYNLIHLETVHLNTNQIRYVSQDIVNLKNLRMLDLGNNKITTFPQVVDRMPKLDYLNVRGNKIKHRILMNYGEIPANADDGIQVEQLPHSRKTSQFTLKSRGDHGSHRSVVSRSFGIYPDSQDLDELLQNGFSRRHIENNYASVVWRDRHKVKDKHDSQNHHDRYPADRPPSYRSSPASHTDFKLLGICNQLEMMLNKQLLQPVLSHRTTMGKSFSDKVQGSENEGIRKSGAGNPHHDMPGVAVLGKESFTITPAGGDFISTVDPKICIKILKNSIPEIIFATLKVIKLDAKFLRNLKETNSLISNIITLGSILLIETSIQVNFDNQVEMSVPLPPACSEQGHLHVVSIQRDKTCEPCGSDPSQYKVTNGYMSLKTWQLTGKLAVFTKAKCKYKAASSAEQLLKTIFKTENSH